MKVTEHTYDEHGYHWVSQCPKCQAELKRIEEATAPPKKESA